MVPILVIKVDEMLHFSHFLCHERGLCNSQLFIPQEIRPLVSDHTLSIDEIYQLAKHLNTTIELKKSRRYLISQVCIY